MLRLASRPGLAIALAVAAGIALHWAQNAGLTGIVWETGRFGDSDDAVRMVQVRDLLAGQSWFDVVQSRIGPPDGLAMHWSRLVDAAIAAFVLTFGMALPMDGAERLARIVWPLLLHVALIVLVVRVAVDVMGPRAALPAGLLAGLGVFFGVQFAPGRIDHHNVQILLALATAWLTLRGQTTPARAAWAGACAAALLAVGFEAVHVVAMCAAVFGMTWIVRGPLAAAPLRAFTVAFAGVSVLLFVATTAPARWTAMACDAASGLSTLAAVLSAVAVMALTSSVRLHGGTARTIATATVFSLIAAGLLALAPECAGGPYGTIDPFLRRHWLDGVLEARGWLVNAREEPAFAFAMAGLILTGIAGLTLGTWRARAEQRPAFAVLLILALTSAVLTGAQVRYAGYATLFALFGTVWLVLSAAALPVRAARWAGVALVMAAGVPHVWALTGIAAFGSPSATRSHECLVPSNFAVLAAAPRGTVLSPVDLGAFVLAHTPHAVVAAPYHRHRDGLRRVLQTLMAPPEPAVAALRQMGTSYVAICPAMTDASDLAAAAPEGLLAELMRGATVPGLMAMPGAGAVRVWTVAP